MPDLLVRGLPKKTIDRLKEQARRNGRSLQKEAKQLLEQGALPTMAEALRQADECRDLFKGRILPDSAELIREDR
jgi:plasmid stability protein